MITNAGLLIRAFIEYVFCLISELNLRLWQESKKMLEKDGKRPVVYNNKCGQICGVNRAYHSKI